ncbi:hypothetical protein C474_15369 [Halogeometricum pallidum JCM 14848]|uniref:DUF8173 domain-containing protein n=1 Tax=Halogeometricum pallidum JCM 14848 TaxID=1227487 RepID=M0D0Y2_HALPD|nr:hypothetical protein [Halogeometricum pallidum]ELZ28498.1 hypothetical protein C474_15369 [Halogeometricum pallidum JCM 14848]
MNGIVAPALGPVATRVAQVGTDVNVDIGPAFGVVGGAVGAFLTTLIVGAILVAAAPGYVERTMATVLEEPVESFLYGLLCLVAVVIVTILLVITLVGILLAIPLGLVAYVVWAVGAAIAFLAIAARLVGREDGWTKPLLVAAGLNGALALTGVGGIVSFGIGAAGFGAVLRNWLA